jgi:hypothetical protein
MISALFVSGFLRVGRFAFRSAFVGFRAFFVATPFLAREVVPFARRETEPFATGFFALFFAVFFVRFFVTHCVPM